MSDLVNLVLLFFTFSFLGWCVEVALKYRQYHRFINRGFLAGPWLPIYGSGATLITVGVGLLPRAEASYGATFLISFVLCGAVEYAVSWFMEKRFHARWWDYSQKPMNLNGRVWIGNLMLFGLGGVLIVKLLNPLFFGLFARMTLRAREILAGLLTAVIAADFAMSHVVLKLVKTGVEKSEADNTEEINREIRRLLSDRSVFHKRFADAYPEVVYRTERIAARMEAIRAETERLRREAEQRMDAVNQRLEQGRERLEGVTISKVDDQRKPIPGTEQHFDCDTLLLSCGLIPENELSLGAGVQLSPATSGAIVDETFETSVPGIFACGNVLHVHDLVDHVSNESFQAGRAAADFVRAGAAASPVIQVTDGDGVRGVVPQKIHRGAAGEVNLMFRPSQVFRNAAAVVTCGGKEVLRKKALIYTPGEMAVLTLKPEQVAALSGDTLTVSMERSE